MSGFESILKSQILNHWARRFGLGLLGEPFFFLFLVFLFLTPQGFAQSQGAPWGEGLGAAPNGPTGVTAKGPDSGAPSAQAEQNSRPSPGFWGPGRAHSLSATRRPDEGDQIEPRRVNEKGITQMISKRMAPVETTRFPARLVYLNGVNVSDLRDETLNQVNVRIDSQGNIHIQGGQYDVSQDTSYHPLLPSELPKLPKAQTQPLDLPQGIQSKQP